MSLPDLYADTLVNPTYANIIDALTAALMERRHPAAIRTLAAQAVHEARVRAMSDAYADLISASEVAERLGVTLRWVTRLAERSHANGQPIGARLGQGKGTIWIFRESDVAALQAMRQPPGRPRQRD